MHWFNNNANRHVKRKEPDGDSEIQEERLKPASARAQLVSATMKYKACDPPTLLESVYVFKYPKFNSFLLIAQLQVEYKL